MTRIIDHDKRKSRGGGVGGSSRPGSARQFRTSPEGQLDTESPTKPLRLVVVSGMSGAGRSTAAQPRGPGLVRGGQPSPSVLPEVCRQAREIDLTRLAVVLDVRTRGFFEQLPSMFTELARSARCPRSCSRQPTTSSCDARSPYAGRIRCRATDGCWTVSGGNARRWQRFVRPPIW